MRVWRRENEKSSVISKVLARWRLTAEANANTQQVQKRGKNQAEKKICYGRMSA